MDEAIAFCVGYVLYLLFFAGMRSKSFRVRIMVKVIVASTVLFILVTGLCLHNVSVWGDFGGGWAIATIIREYFDYRRGQFKSRQSKSADASDEFNGKE